MAVAYQVTNHTFKNLKPTLGQPDPSLPHEDDHERHLRAVFAASPRGFSFGIERHRRAA